MIQRWKASGEMTTEPDGEYYRAEDAERDKAEAVEHMNRLFGIEREKVMRLRDLNRVRTDEADRLKLQVEKATSALWVAHDELTNIAESEDLSDACKTADGGIAKALEYIGTYEKLASAKTERDDLRRKLDRAVDALQSVLADVLAASEVCRAAGMLPNTSKELRETAGEIEDALREIESPVDRSADAFQGQGHALPIEGAPRGKRILQLGCSECDWKGPQSEWDAHERSHDSLRLGVWPAEMGQAIVDNRKAITEIKRRLDAAHSHPELFKEFLDHHFHYTNQDGSTMVGMVWPKDHAVDIPEVE